MSDGLAAGECKAGGPIKFAPDAVEELVPVGIKVVSESEFVA